MEIISLIWNQVFIRPMTNGLVLLYLGLFHNFGLSILIFTLLVRVATLPLTLRQIRQTRALSQIQPRIQEIQQKYSGDRQRVSQETFRLYREYGINPIGCLGPIVIQMPIWIGLYWALIKLLPATPEALVGLGRLLYSWGPIHESIPINSRFLGIDLALPDRTPILPILVGVSMWVQQKISTYPSTDPRQRQTNQLMLWMFPLMFGVFTFQFPSGLAIYWVASNLIGVAIQYKLTGWGGLRSQPAKAPEAPAPAPAASIQPAEGKDGEKERGGVSQDRRRSDRAGAKAARRRARGGRGRGH